MAYLTFSEYNEYGGTATEESFANLERTARHKLDYFTQDRLQTYTTIPEIVKEVMTEFINKLSTNSTNNDTIKSYSNGIESFSYVNKTDMQLMSELHDIAIEWLPIELISSELTLVQP